MISDEQLARTLGVYAGMVDRVLDQPERWLGVDDAPSAVRSVPGKVLHVVRRSVSGEVHPGSPEWSSQPLRERVRWWVRRIGITAGTAAAAPRFSGMLSDRLPFQAALGASASALAVCAVARENGIEPDQWVPLLGRVIFDRDLSSAGGEVADTASSEEALTAAVQDTTEPPSAMKRLGEGGQRAVRSMWRLARTLLEVQDLFDERPRGGFMPRTIAKLPVVGVLGGWLDERGAIASAAKQTQRQLKAQRSA